MHRIWRLHHSTLTFASNPLILLIILRLTPSTEFSFSPWRTRLSTHLLLKHKSNQSGNSFSVHSMRHGPIAQNQVTCQCGTTTSNQSPLYVDPFSSDELGWDIWFTASRRQLQHGITHHTGVYIQKCACPNQRYDYPRRKCAVLSDFSNCALPFLST